MKKLIAYLLSHACFYIGDWCCKLSCMKRNGEFLIDKPKFTKVLGWAFDGYQRFMHWSLQLQEWAGNETPWKIPT
jgi:hypothetical protein